MLQLVPNFVESPAHLGGKADQNKHEGLFISTACTSDYRYGTDSNYWVMDSCKIDAARQPDAKSSCCHVPLFQDFSGIYLKGHLDRLNL